MDLPDSSSGINISDVIEVIETDQTQERSKMEVGVGRREGPYIKIVEQPASKALRFRYECEGRSAGSIPGVNSTQDNKTYPTIQIVGYTGRAIVVVSCVTKDQPYRPHPHNLVGRDGCKRGVCTVEVNNETMTQSFDHLGIQCVKKKDIEEALKVREEIRVDPFRRGFSHRTQPGSIDLNAVRLCFQAFLEDEPGKFKLALIPVVSEIIYDKKALCDLAICKLSQCSASVAGGQEIILLCEKVAKEDISVRLYEERNGQVIWEGLGDFTPTQVHKQVAISFKTPRYKTLQVDSPVHVFIQLRRPSDGETSDSLPFQLTPLDSGAVSAELNRKKQKVSHDVDKGQDTLRTNPLGSPGLAVKREPPETSPNPYGGVYHGGVSPITYRTPSPMDYNPVSPNYQVTYATPNVAFPPRTVPATSLAALNHPVSSLSPQLPRLTTSIAQATVGRISPHPSYTLPGSSEMYVQAPNMVEPLPNGIFLDISKSIPTNHNTLGNPNAILGNPNSILGLPSSLPGLPVQPMTDFDDIHVSLDEGNLSENLSINLSLNCELDQMKKNASQQENMTDSFTRLANNAYHAFEN